MISETNVLIFALLGGIVPALFWLWFWIREDKLKPEPKLSLLSSFAGGVFAVLLALFFELIIYYLFVDSNYYNIKDLPNILQTALQSLANKYHLVENQAIFWDKIQYFFTNIGFSTILSTDIKKIFLVVIIAPIVEELFKLLLTYNTCLRKKVNDEPIDASIYMLTAALGFAAVETALILIEPITKGNVVDTLVAANIRSVGPMLLHLISSASLGLIIGMAFYKSKAMKFLYLILGFVTAVILHALFNLFIILNETTHNISFFWIACFGTWTFVIVLLVSFERVKRVTPAKATVNIEID